MTTHAKDTIVKLALGSIFRLGSRPTRPGDVETYEVARRAILEVLDPVERLDLPAPDSRPCYPRQRNQGAAGD